jgi:hypothetical protein
MLAQYMCYLSVNFFVTWLFISRTMAVWPRLMLCRMLKVVEGSEQPFFGFGAAEPDGNPESRVVFDFNDKCRNCVQYGMVSSAQETHR